MLRAEAFPSAGWPLRDYFGKKVPGAWRYKFPNQPGSGLLVLMEYRGKSYTIVQGVGPNSWKWTVRLDEKTVKSGEAPSRDAAKTNVVWLVDKALALKKVKPPSTD